MSAEAVGVYGRISRTEKKGGHGATIKIERQHEEGAAYFARTPGFEEAPVVFYRDNKSAWDPEVTREDWERMLRDIRAGTLRAVVAYHLDRFTRQGLQSEILWAACKETGTELHTVQGGRISEVIVLRAMMLQAANESDVKSGRQALHHDSLAKRGGFSGGWRTFGYLDGMADLHPVESEIVRDIVARFLAGETLHSLAKSLNAAGIPSVTGRVNWTGPNLRQYLMRPTLAGFRVHHKVTYEAAWPGIIDTATHETIVAKLADPARRANKGSNARKYLLSGMATCHECGQPLRARTPSKNDPRRFYACATGRHCHRPVEIVDARVEHLVIARLSQLNAAAVFRDDAAVLEVERLTMERDALTRRKQEAADAFNAGELDRETLRMVNDGNTRERDRVQSLLNAARTRVSAPLAALEGMTGPGAAEAWAKAPLGQRRKVIETLCTVSLKGAATRRAPFHAHDVVIGWERPPR